MEGCLAPSEIPGIEASDASLFGAVAENIIVADFMSQKPYPPLSIYVDNYNPAGYILFLAINNRQFTESKQKEFYFSLRLAELGVRRPDIITHTVMLKEFYEIKPDSLTGVEDGISKVGTLSASYMKFKLPYTPGVTYNPNSVVVASFLNQLKVQLKVTLKGPGLIVYKLCVSTTGMVELLALAALMRYVVKKIIDQKGLPSFKPIDLEPALAREGQLAYVAKAMGLTMVIAAAGTVSWKFFWKAVAKRFAARGATAAFLAAVDGPLPIGDLIAAGMSIWMVVDIIRFSGDLWKEARQIEMQGA
ncbi:hypothetical protein WBG78_14220 [Chryseolinea sp. T2]|uniref:hypothetical protein n=1 Tax=Chryseolinea sp. T2 TaxID=3129255 RepID=UPI003077982D